MEQSPNSISKSFVGAIIGLIAGYPISYWFQPEMLRQKFSLSKYIENIGKVLGDKDLVPNVVISCIVFAVIGGVIGYFMDKQDAPKV